MARFSAMITREPSKEPFFTLLPDFFHRRHASLPVRNLLRGGVTMAAASRAVTLGRAASFLNVRRVAVTTGPPFSIGTHPCERGRRKALGAACSHSFSVSDVRKRPFYQV